jgi:hypothetical protein
MGEYWLEALVVIVAIVLAARADWERDQSIERKWYGYRKKRSNRGTK